jgi:hypothetical protein
MADRTYTDDLAALMRQAEQAITLTLRDGQRKYVAGAWLTHSMDDHLRRAAAHLKDLLDEMRELTSEEFDTAFSHLICRAVMAWGLRAGNAARRA